MLRPVVFLPSAVLAWPVAAVEPVIAHEMVHVRRLDQVWIVVANSWQQTPAGHHIVRVMRDGQPLDTTMGFTPSGGVMMGTRTGDIDPGVLLYLLREGYLGTDDTFSPDTP